MWDKITHPFLNFNEWHLFCVDTRVGRTPTHHCTISDGGLANDSIPYDKDTGGLQKCAMYAENSTNVTTSCDYGWTYNNVDGDYTIVNEVIIVVIAWAWITIDFNTPARYLRNETSWWRHKMKTFSALLALCHRWIPLTKASDAEL